MSYWRVPLDAGRHEVVVGKVNIIAGRCKGCGYCVEFCPNEVLAACAEFNEKGYYPPEVIREGGCVNCNYCETICPEFAIFCTVAERRPLRPDDVVTETQRRLGRRRRQAAAQAP